ncbi:unnamed protein product [Staurois parvus]|uniref:Uncharacterized protein n=1 Tax=Staurois parvus TaxID=386267 RepID=A0ABN9CZR1_9NEOB|nr:unnamed protein product [Staurois parvus]
MQSGKYCSPVNCQTQTYASDCQTEKLIHHSREHVSTAVEFIGIWLSCCCSQLHPLCYNTTNS